MLSGVNRCFDSTCGYPGEGPSTIQLVQEQDRVMRLIATEHLNNKDAGRTVPIRKVCKPYGFNYDQNNEWIPTRGSIKNVAYSKLSRMIAKVKSERTKNKLQRELQEKNERRQENHLMKSTISQQRQILRELNTQNQKQRDDFTKRYINHMSFTHILLLMITLKHTYTYRFKIAEKENNQLQQALSSATKRVKSTEKKLQANKEVCKINEHTYIVT